MSWSRTSRGYLSHMVFPMVSIPSLIRSLPCVPSEKTGRGVTVEWCVSKSEPFALGPFVETRLLLRMNQVKQQNCATYKWLIRLKLENGCKNDQFCKCITDWQYCNLNLLFRAELPTCGPLDVLNQLFGFDFGISFWAHHRSFQVTMRAKHHLSRPS